MNTHPVTLASGQHWSTARAASLIVRCHAGTLWVTTHGNHDDHTLQAGESLQLRQSRGILIGALTTATFDITGNLPLSERAHGTQAIPGRRFFGAAL